MTFDALPAHVLLLDAHQDWPADLAESRVAACSFTLDEYGSAHIISRVSQLPRSIICLAAISIEMNQLTKQTITKPRMPVWVQNRSF